MSSGNNILGMAKCALKVSQNIISRMGAANVIFVGLVGYAVVAE